MCMIKKKRIIIFIMHIKPILSIMFLFNELWPDFFLNAPALHFLDHYRTTRLQCSANMHAFRWIISLFSLFVSPCLFGEPFLYHGSSVDGIECLEPRLRYTPGDEEMSPAGIYASDLPAFAAAHSFPWSSDEGIDLYVDEGTVFLQVPHSLAPRLQRSTFIYVVDGSQFTFLTCEATGHTFRATKAIPCLQKMSFPSVTDAITHYGGHVVIMPARTTGNSPQ